MADRDLLEKLFLIHQLLEKLESTPHDFGTGDLLYSSEIHTLVAVDEHPQANLTSLASAMQVSVPAVHKFVTRLVKAEYLEKTKHPESGRDVIISLTSKGKAAVEGHQQFAAQTFASLRAVEAQLDDEQYEVVANFLESLIEECSWK